MFLPSEVWSVDLAEPALLDANIYGVSHTLAVFKTLVAVIFAKLTAVIFRSDFQAKKMVEAEPLPPLPATATEDEKRQRYKEILDRLKLILQGARSLVFMFGHRHRLAVC